MTNDLPHGWMRTQIADVAEVQLGRQRSPQHHFGKQMRQYLRAANVTWQGISLDDVKEMNFDDADFEKYRLYPGDLLLNEASGSPHEVGKPAIWNNEIEGCCFQNTLLRLRAHAMDRDYLYWYCYSSALLGLFGEAGRGVNIRHLGKRGLAQFPIPIAPLAEQKRIVAAIEDHFSRLDAVEVVLAQTVERLDALRSSVFADVFGTRSDLPPEWAWKTIDEVAVVQLGRQRAPEHHAGERMRPYLRSANVTWSGISLHDVKEMHFDETDFEKYRLEPGDLLLNEASGSPGEVGKPAVWKGEIDDCCFQNTLLRLRPREVELNYLYWYCYSCASSGQFGEAGRGVNIRHLGKQGLARFPVPVPPRREQALIAERIRTALEHAESLRHSVREAVTHIAALRRSVLAAAFSGQLVPQDPNDQPASVLLERIAASRTTEPNRRASARQPS